MLKQVIEILDILDDAGASGEKVKSLLNERGLNDITVKQVEGEKNTKLIL